MVGEGDKVEGKREWEDRTPTCAVKATDELRMSESVPG